MPGERRIQIVPQPVARHEGLCGAALFAGAAVKCDRAVLAGLLKVALDADGCRHCACAEQVVSAAVTGAAGDGFQALQTAALLGQTRERVILGENADVRFAAAKACGKSGGDAADPLLHAETLLLQNLFVQCGGLHLLKRQLGKAPDLIGDIDDQVRFLVNYGKCRFFFCVFHKESSC